MIPWGGGRIQFVLRVGQSGTLNPVPTHVITCVDEGDEKLIAGHNVFICFPFKIESIHFTAGYRVCLAG